MSPQQYILEVNRRLCIPPLRRLLELNCLAREISRQKACKASSHISLGTPEETARNIQVQYPPYRKCPLRYLPLLIALGGFWQLLCMFYVLRSGIGERVALSAETAALSPSLTPGQYAFRCILAISVGLYYYYFFKYSPVK